MQTNKPPDDSTFHNTESGPEIHHRLFRLLPRIWHNFFQEELAVGAWLTFHNVGNLDKESVMEFYANDTLPIRSE
jgi:hypothetical protein